MRRSLTLTLLGLLSLAAAILPGAVSRAATTATASAARPAASSAGGCQYIDEPPRGWILVCGNGGGTGGSPGSGGGGSAKYACTYTILSKAQRKYLQLGNAPKGKKWAAITCPGKDPFGGITQVSTATGQPLVPPQDLLQIALGRLEVPVLAAQTAPRRGRDGLVALPEWYWIPRGYQPITITVTAGPVSATLVAQPTSLTFNPGGGLPDSSCRGPGTPYSAGAQTECTYTYRQSSATQPGGAYAAAVTVTWKVSWSAISPAGNVPQTTIEVLPVPYAFNQRVAEGQALVTGSGVGP